MARWSGTDWIDTLTAALRNPLAFDWGGPVVRTNALALPVAFGSGIKVVPSFLGSLCEVRWESEGDTRQIRCHFMPMKAAEICDRNLLIGHSKGSQGCWSNPKVR